MDDGRRARAAERLPGDGRGPTDHRQVSGAIRSVGAEHHIGIEDGDERVEIATSGSGDERIDDSALPGHVGVWDGDGALDATPCAAGQLPGRGRGPVDNGAISSNGMAKVLVRFEGFRGRYVMHCHNLEHEDMAMMANIDIR